MFDFTNPVITKVSNPLQVTKSSVIEFTAGPLAKTGLYRFNKIVEMNFGERMVTRYVIYSQSENTEYVFEVFKGNGEQLECYIYNLIETMPFSDEFLKIAGQRFITTPKGDEYQRSIESPQEITDGVLGKSKVYDIEIDKIEKEYEIKSWDYQRPIIGGTEYLNIEMSQENGEFKIFIGELIEEIFYKFYQITKLH